MAFTHLANCGAQFVDKLCQQVRSPIRQVDGEEERASGDEVAAIVGHSQPGTMGFASLYPSYASWPL
jgi:hypothetical protein